MYIRSWNNTLNLMYHAVTICYTPHHRILMQLGDQREYEELPKCIVNHMEDEVKIWNHIIDIWSKQCPGFNFIISVKDIFVSSNYFLTTLSIQNQSLIQIVRKHSLYAFVWRQPPCYWFQGTSDMTETCNVTILYYILLRNNIHV
jgi:hypothetical protein